jgi:hypothetical protein
MKSLSKEVVTKRIKPDGSGYTVVAGTSALTSDIVDTAGYDGVRFILMLGTITSGAVTSSKLQQNDANTTSGMADLVGSSITIADTDDNKMVIHQIWRPQERYLQMVISRGTQNAVIDGLIVELYNPRTEPVTQDSTVATLETYFSPAEGTA